MHETKHKRALPVYIAAAVFALYALLLPLYSLWHFLIAALVTAAAWLLADKLIKPVSEFESIDVDNEESASSTINESTAFTDVEAMAVDTEIKVMDRCLDSDGLGETDAIQEFVKNDSGIEETPKDEKAQTEYAAAEEAMLRAAQEKQE